MKSMETASIKQIVDDVQSALEIHVQKMKDSQVNDPDKHKMYLSQMDKVSNYIYLLWSVMIVLWVALKALLA